MDTATILSTFFSAGQMAVLLVALNYYWKGHSAMEQRMTRVETKIDMMLGQRD